MLEVVGCFVGYHDLRLVVLAALICLVASAACVEILHHSGQASARARAIWTGVAAFAGGSGIWATHFIAMLAFAPGLPSRYDVALTLYSLAIAVALSWTGFATATLSRNASAPCWGGVIVGCGIAAMHYTGMAAFQIAGHVHWNAILVMTSLAVGVGLSGAALGVALKGKAPKWRITGELLLVFAICGLHFIGMGAVVIVPDPTIDVDAGAMPASFIALAVAFASLMFLFLVNVALMLDIRERRRASSEARLQSLANATVEGLLICREHSIVTANKSFGDLVGIPATSVTGASVLDYVPDAAGLPYADEPERALETNLRAVNGAAIPVELISRPVEYGDAPHYAIAVRDLRARRSHEAKIRFLAGHDALTGLPNRHAFNDRFKQEIALACSHGRMLAVLCLDLDRFKEVNDTLGHAAGDAVLIEVARRVSGVLDDTQMLARLGGDEFAVLASVDHAEAAGGLAARILETLRIWAGETAGPVFMASLGIALYPDGNDDDDADEGGATLLRQADAALCQAKSEGRGTYRFYDARIGAELREHRILELDLRHALSRGELFLVYQPQADLSTESITGFEALLRWQHPERGYVSPALFIPIAEESGSILQIGEWVLREACREAASWPIPLSIAVNVSAVQIHAHTLVQVLRETLASTGLEPGRLELEMTETALVRDPDRALTTLQQIKALGVHLAMDDFGTGYSSLSNLRRYPFDRIKIDRSFVRSVETNPQAAAIVRSVVGLGRGLDMQIVAEGVETLRELHFLKAQQCDAVQGYLLGRPSDIDTFSEHTHGSPGTPPCLISRPTSLSVTALSSTIVPAA